MGIFQVSTVNEQICSPRIFFISTGYLGRGLVLVARLGPRPISETVHYQQALFALNQQASCM